MTDPRATSVELLNDLGYLVLEANNADNALAIVNSGVKIDLLFTDVVMPGELRSPELARRAMQKLPGLQVLFTSGYTQNAIVHSGQLDDGVELIAKPFTRERLAQKIRAVLSLRENALPPSEVAVSHNPQKRTDTRTEPAAKLRILVVEDEILIRMTLCEMLHDGGHEVVEAGTISTAKHKLSNEDFDVMITDLGLPDGSGEELVRQTLISHTEVTVIFASGRAAKGAFQDVPGSAKIQYLTKPYNEVSLNAALSRI